MVNPVELYSKYHKGREDERIGLFTTTKKKFSIAKALYPGSFVHATPSFVFPEVVYVDSMRSAMVLLQ